MRQAMLLVCTLLVASCSTGQGTRLAGDAEPTPSLPTGAQSTCPVMEGKRINPRLYVDYQGVRIYVCCNACVRAVRKEPQKYIERLRNQGIVSHKP